MNLLIVESGNKAKKIRATMGKGHKLIFEATGGHLMDLPRGPKAVKIKEDGALHLQWEVTRTGKIHLGKLRSAAHRVRKAGGKIYIATDPDREGEAIGAHVRRLLHLPKRTPRIRFNSVEQSAILKALAQGGTLDEPLVEAQEARKGLDRVVGYGLSGMLNSPIGRVQAPALRAAIEQYVAWKNFHPATSYQPGCTVFGHFFALPGRACETEEEAMKLARAHEGTRVKMRVRKQRRVQPPPPTDTPAVLKQFANKHGVGKVADALQSLFMDGCVTYPRTDSTRLSQDWVAEHRGAIGRGRAGAGDTPRGKRGAHDQEGHEAVRPTATTVGVPANIRQRPAIEQEVYAYIAQRATQACMKPADTTVVTLELNNGAKATFTREDAPGWRELERILAPADSKERQAPAHPDLRLWNLKKDDEVQSTPATTTIKERHPEKPTQGWLIAWMKDEGIGRPGTYVSTIKKLRDHNYLNGNKGALVPTARGLRVIDQLRSVAADVVDPAYTMIMEEKLDEIASGQAAPTSGSDLVRDGLRMIGARGTVQTGGGSSSKQEAQAA